MKEIWKGVLGYQDSYEVSNLGRIKSKTRQVYAGNGRFRIAQGKLLKPGEHPSGSLHVNLWCNGKSISRKIHQLVLESFVGVRKRHQEGCHNDGNPKNNCINNLRWDTRSSNHFDKRKHGTNGGIKVKRSDGAVFNSLTEAAHSVSSSVSNISNVLRGQRKVAGGYTWIRV